MRADVDRRRASRSGSAADRRPGSRRCACPPSTTAIGVGAFGAADEDGTHRLRRVARGRRAPRCICPPTAPRCPTTWWRRARRRSDVRAVARARLRRAPSRDTCASKPTEPGDTVTLSTLATLCLELSAARRSACVVVVAETDGARRRGAPAVAAPTEDGDLFAFPGVRTRLTFTAERAFGGGARAHRRRRAARRGRPAARQRSSGRSTAKRPAWGTSTPPRSRSGRSRRDGCMLAETVRALFDGSGRAGRAAPAERRPPAGRRRAERVHARRVLDRSRRER